VAQYTSFTYGEPSPSVRSNSDISRIFDGNSSQLFIDWDWITDANLGPVNNSVNTIIWSYGSSTSLAYHGGNSGSATLVFGGSTGFTTSESLTPLELNFATLKQDNLILYVYIALKLFCFLVA
jgi:hypothetical protein